MHLVLSGDGTGVVDGVGAVDIDLTANFSAWGQPVDIPEPQNARQLDPTSSAG